MAAVANEMYAAGFLRQNAAGSMELVDEQAERESLQAQRVQERQQQEEQQRRERRQSQVFQSAEALSEAQVDNEFLDAHQ